MNDLLEKLETIYQRWLGIGEEISQPDIMADDGILNLIKIKDLHLLLMPIRVSECAG